MVLYLIQDFEINETQNMKAIGNKIFQWASWTKIGVSTRTSQNLNPTDQFKNGKYLLNQRITQNNTQTVFLRKT